MRRRRAELSPYAPFALASFQLITMPNRVWDAIHKTCDAIRELPDADAPSALFDRLGIDRGRYDATGPIRSKLSEVLEFLGTFESIGADKFPMLPSAIVESLIDQLRVIAGIADDVRTKCRRWPLAAVGVVPPSFQPGEIAAKVSSVDAAYTEIYSRLNPLLTRSSNSQSEIHGFISETQRVVFPLHGIRTRADWQKDFTEVAQTEKWKCRLKKWNFGRMSLLNFLWPIGRAKKIKWFEKTYTDEINNRNIDLKGDERPSVVAHSFGTYIVGWALFKYEELKLNKIILCGSILPTDFPWDVLLERGQVRGVRNEFGVKDVWVKWVRFFVPRTGPSGSKGFSRRHPRLEQKRFEFQHSEYFREGHMKAFWMPFLNRREPAVVEKQLTAKAPAWFPPVGSYLIIILLVIALMPVLRNSIPRGTAALATLIRGHSTDCVQIASKVIGTWKGGFRKFYEERSDSARITEWAEITVEFFPNNTAALTWASTGAVDWGSWSCQDGVIKSTGKKSDFIATLAGNTLSGKFSKFGEESFTLTRQ
jgi:hypothetical protein